MSGPPNNDPKFLKAFRDLDEALSLQRQGLFAEADKIYARVVKKNPDYFDALHIYGSFKYQQGQYNDAFKLVARATRLNPKSANALSTLGVILAHLERHAEALASFDAALKIDPNHLLALSNRCNSLNALELYADTISSSDRALAINPNYAEVYIPRGAALSFSKRFTEALASYEMAIRLNPNLAMAWNGCGNILSELKRYDGALFAYDKALALDADLIGVEGKRLHAKMHLGIWKDFDAECARIISSVRSGNPVTQPFPFLALPSSAEDQLKCAKLWVNRQFPVADKPIWRGERYGHDRIRVAYASADFRDHPVSHLMTGMFEAHDKSRFDVTAISLEADNSEMRQRLRTSVDRFIDAETYANERLAQVVRELEIDVLIDLMGFTANSRPEMFARRPAPIQVNYLGYACTMGAKYIDYIVADKTIIPEGSQQNYSEKIAYLPNSFLPYDSKRKISDRVPSRVECGLPETGFVFCSFNQIYKITPQIYDIWMRLLRAVNNSVLWLSNTNEIAMNNLRREAQSRGVDPNRIIFAKRVPLNEDHLARHRLADLFLDTSPYNAHSTACDALWAGLPVLTIAGNTMAGRVAASLLNALGMTGLICASAEEYEKMAVDFAMNPEKMISVKHALAEKRLVAPLFDTKLFTRHIEAAYTAMHARYQANLQPDHIVVANSN